MANRDLNLILAALFELRLTCLESERTWNDIGNVAEALGGQRSAVYFGAPAPDRGRSDRTPLPASWTSTCVTREASHHLSRQMELNDDERDLILAGLFELAVTYIEDDDMRERWKALAVKLGGDAEAMFFGADQRGAAR